ncbi:Na-translocating system protein MpsC family protein [Neobacillus sp. D3-1R]|uniref:Na-translocating system protein MpsC family protein n=1 Tax=Neobacillus sp. D3-1R TaxID=3445778 RepID=UPI003F9FFA8E
MQASIQENLLSISNLTSKLLRKNFGRGPDSCHASLNNRFLVFYIRGFLTPMETVLLENGNSDNIEISRNIVMQNLLSQLKGVLEIEFELDVVSYYHDWNYPNNTGTIIVEFESAIITVQNIDSFPQHEPLVNEVNRISILVEKSPEKIEAYQITNKLFLVKRIGVLVPIEKALIAKGFQQTLNITKDELEKSYLHRDGRFETIFNQPVLDIFVDWNFNEDNSVICFVLKSLP